VTLNPAVQALLTEVSLGDTAVRADAVRQAALAGTDAIVQLGEVMSGGDPAAAKAASEALRSIVHNAGRPGAEKEASAASAQLQKLLMPKYPRAVRAAAVRYLGYIGRAEAVQPLANLLIDVDLREDARMALERIPGTAAEKALRDALRIVPKDWQAAVLQSLDARHTSMRRVGIKAESRKSAQP
jgi:HEAT repeat protein